MKKGNHLFRIQIPGSPKNNVLKIKAFSTTKNSLAKKENKNYSRLKNESYDLLDSEVAILDDGSVYTYKNNTRSWTKIENPHPLKHPVKAQESEIPPAAFLEFIFGNPKYSVNKSNNILQDTMKTTSFIVTNYGVYFFETDIVTDVEDVNSKINPSKFTLEQNYPNPFNPTTKIKYSTPSSVESHLDAYVQLKVFDILGREITTLVNEKKQPGEYEVEFNASNLPSGVYFYQLQAGDFVQTKKMLLLK